jgi:aryl-alcohol dehydrogenase-like predicted oxidoreductase
MEYRLLGRTGVQVSPLCLGAMMFGLGGNDERADNTASSTAIHRALDAGINFIDTPTSTREACPRRSWGRR